jgi:hypothetical protein
MGKKMSLFNLKKPETIQSSTKNNSIQEQNAGDNSELIQASNVVINNINIYISIDGKWESRGIEVSKQIHTDEQRKNELQ